MSCKVTMKNGISSTEAQWIKANALVDTTVKLAGEEAKDRLYEPKHKKKLVRVLTVIAYVFCVSLAAIMLSLYYVFLWNGGQRGLPKYTIQSERQAKCNNMGAVAEMQQQITDPEIIYSETTTTEAATTWSDYEDFKIVGRQYGRSTFIKRLMYTDPYVRK